MVPFLLVGFIVLMIWPDDTNLLFAWSIQSRMTALMLAAVYAGGAYFFSRVYLARQWHTVAMGFLPATLYAVLGGLITIIHWDDFNHSSIAFTVWVAMYGISSGLIPFVWWRNHQMDPRMPFPQDVILPRPFIYLWIFLGVCNLLIGGFLFILPLALADHAACRSCHRVAVCHPGSHIPGVNGGPAVELGSSRHGNSCGYFCIDLTGCNPFVGQL
jgi:hypothetical protein